MNSVYADAPARRLILSVGQECPSAWRLNDAFILKRREVERACPTFDQDRSLHATLRSQTRLDHQAIDNTLSRFDFSDAVSYQAFLSVHMHVLEVLARYCGRLERQEIADMVACLCDDLDIQRAQDAEEPTAAVSNDPAAQAGVAYVVRGSRLGAPFLLHRVASGLPTAYLAHRPALDWCRFIESLALLHPSPAAAARQAVPSARAAFHVFTTAATVVGILPRPPR